VNATIDALRPLGIRHLDMPFTPARLWQAIQVGPVPLDAVPSFRRGPAS
jgi:carbon-monoxide dehydrogenase large subunit